MKVTTTFLYVSPWVDVDRSTFLTIVQPGYDLARVAAEYALTENWTVFGRDRELFNVQYENPAGFLRPGLGIYGGAQAGCRRTLGNASHRDKNREWHVSGSAELLEFSAGQLADAETAWSIGTFGAIGEFMRDAGEAVAFQNADGSISAVTARGGLRIKARDALRPIASELLTTQSWKDRVALCLPGDTCAMSGRDGSHRNRTRSGCVARRRSGGGALFDLGLGTLQLDACVRIAEAEVVAALQKLGRPIAVRSRQRRDGRHPGGQSPSGFHQPRRTG